MCVEFLIIMIEFNFLACQFKYWIYALLEQNGNTD